MKHKNLLINLLFAAVVLGIAGALFALRAAKPDSGSALTAQLIYGDDNTVLDFPLDGNARYDVDTGYYTVHIEVADGAARFVDSPCPDHVCESFGWISLEDQSATCLPARAVLTIVPAS
ncbi:MAG: NusG domain II-containing protein [Faecalibacterium sp.]